MPNTFLKPMEASINAVRHMALNPEGKRPSYGDLSMEINAKGDLVSVMPREQGSDLSQYEENGVIAPANLYFDISDNALNGAVASATTKEAH